MSKRMSLLECSPSKTLLRMAVLAAFGVVAIMRSNRFCGSAGHADAPAGAGRDGSDHETRNKRGSEHRTTDRDWMPRMCSVSQSIVPLSGPIAKQFRHYAFEAFKPELKDRLPQLVRLLSEQGLGAPDRKRKGFYNLQDEGHWCYIHVHEASRTIYLVGYRRSGSAQPSQWSDSFGKRTLSMANC